MEKSDGEKLLPDLELDGVKSKRMKKAEAEFIKLSSTLDELPIEDDRDNKTDTETETDSVTNSDSDSDSEYECNVCKRKISGYIPFKQHQKGKKHAKAVLKKKREKKLLEKGADDEIADGDDGNLIQEPYTVCETCDKQFTGPESYQMHLKSKPHKRKVLEASILEQVQENGEINADKLKELYKKKQRADDVLEDIKVKFGSLKLQEGDEKTHDEFECKECDKVFSGLTPFTQHLISKTHAKQVEKKKLLHKVIPGTSGDYKISDESKKNDVSSLSVEDDVLVCKVCSTSFSGPESAAMHLKSKKHSKNLDKYLRKLAKKRAKKESKNSELDSGKKEKEARPGKESQDEEPESTTNPFDEPDISDNSEEETAKPSLSGDEVDEGLVADQKYKKYKDLMHSLHQEDKMPG